MSISAQLDFGCFLFVFIPVFTYFVCLPISNEYYLLLNSIFVFYWEDEILFFFNLENILIELSNGSLPPCILRVVKTSLVMMYYSFKTLLDLTCGHFILD
jgi:hypothetical protein